METSKHLIELLKKKDEPAFDEVYRKYYRLVKHVAYTIIPSECIAEDIAQETFLKMYENIDTYQNDVSFTAWLCTISRNLALNEKKKRSRLSEMPEYEKADNDMRPDEKAEENQLLERIKALLSEKDYDLLIMRLYHRLSYKELSKMTGESVAALTNRYHRIIKKIKQNIEP